MAKQNNSLIKGPNGELGFYDATGKFVAVKDGKLVKGPNGELGAFNEKGEFIPFVKEGNDSSHDSSKKLVSASTGEQQKDSKLVKGPKGELGFYDEKGNFVKVKNGEFATNGKGQIGVYDENGNFIVYPGPNRVVLQTNKEGKTGFFDSNGNFVEVRGGKLTVGPGGKLGTYDEKGNFIPFKDAKLVRLENGDTGYYDESGNFVVVEKEKHAGPVINVQRIRKRSLSTNKLFVNNKPRKQTVTRARRSRSPQLRHYWQPDPIPPNFVIDKDAAVRLFLEGDERFAHVIKNFQVSDGLTSISIFDYIDIIKNKTSKASNVIVSPRNQTARGGRTFKFFATAPAPLSARPAPRKNLIFTPIVSPREPLKNRIFTPKTPRPKVNYRNTVTRVTYSTQVSPRNKYSPLMISHFLTKIIVTKK